MHVCTRIFVCVRARAGEPLLGQTRCKKRECDYPWQHRPTAAGQHWEQGMPGAKELLCRTDEAQTQNEAAAESYRWPYDDENDAFFVPAIRQNWHDAPHSGRLYSLERVTSDLLELEASDWIDGQTCLVWTRTQIYNPSYKVGEIQKIVFAFDVSGMVRANAMYDDTGTVFGSYSLTFKLDPFEFETRSDVVRGLALLMLFLLGIAKLVGSAKDIVASTRRGARFTRKIYYDITGTAFWVTTDVAFYAMIVLTGIARTIELVSAKQYMKEYADQYVWSVPQRSTVYLVMVGIQYAVNSAIGLIFALKIFKCLNLIPGLNMINRMISSIGVQLIGLAAASLIVMLVVAVSATAFFGHKLSTFSTWWRAYAQVFFCICHMMYLIEDGFLRCAADVHRNNT